MSALKLKYSDFACSVQRDFADDAVEVLIEVTDYREPHYVRGTDPRDPQNDPGSVSFGDAHYLDGRECVLTELEKEAVEAAFWRQ